MPSPRGVKVLARPAARLLPEVALAVAALIAVGRLTGIGGGLVGGLVAVISPWLPFDPTSVDPLDAATAAFALGALAAGVRRRKRLAWPLAVILFAAALVAQLLVLRHPIGAAVSVGCLAVLIADVRHFRAGTERRMRRIVIGIMTTGVVTLVLGSILAGLVAAAPTGSPMDSLATWAVEVLGFLDPTGYVSPEHAGDLLEALEFLVGTAVLVAAMALLVADPDRPSPELLDRDRSIARRHAVGSLAPFQVGPDTFFYGEPTGQGVVAYGRAGRMAIVLGDAIGRPPAARQAFRAFEARCAAGDIDLGVYQASAAAAAGLRELGYRVFRVGEEAVISLPTWGLAGSRRANVRHTIVRSAKGGVTVTWRPDGLNAGELDRWRAQLVEVDRAWQAGHGPALRFTISPFDPAGLGVMGVAIATDPDDRVQAFATFRRTEPDGWVLDLMRRRKGGVPGALEACIAAAASGMREAGDLELSLGLVALAGLDVRHGPPEERLLALGRRLVGRAYDVEGLRFFKAKFDPEWRPRFGAIEGSMAFVPYLIALLRLHLSLGVARPTLPPTGDSPTRRLRRRLGRFGPATNRAASSRP